ncbi:MAG: hypothetical protein ACRD19_11650 [Terriglobia bacterium]
MKPHRRLFFAGAVILILGIVVVRTYAWDADDEEDKEAAVAAPSRVSIENGQTVITLDASTQKRMGLQTAVLYSTEARAQATSTATVLSAQGLLALRSSYVAAQTQIQKAQASVDVSEKEYRRLRSLYQRNQDVSKKSVEAAEGVLRTGQASLAAARQDLPLQKFAVEQIWGRVIARWISEGNKKLDQVLDQSLLPIQVTLPPEKTFHAPPRITLSGPDGELIHAQYLSLLPRTGSLVQRASLLYLTTSRPSLAPGMNLVARLPEGPLRHGVIVPHSSIVWRQGRAWAYVQVSATRFIRKPVSTAAPLLGGYFVVSGFDRGDRVVTQGAQFLLSEEFRSQIQPQD